MHRIDRSLWCFPTGNHTVRRRLLWAGTWLWGGRGHLPADVTRCRRYEGWSFFSRPMLIVSLPLRYIWSKSRYDDAIACALWNFESQKKKGRTLAERRPFIFDQQFYSNLSLTANLSLFHFVLRVCLIKYSVNKNNSNDDIFQNI